MFRDGDPRRGRLQGSEHRVGRAGRGVETLAREFAPGAATIAGWIKQAGMDDGLRDDGPTGLERERWRACAKGIASFGWNATSTQRLRPGALGQELLAEAFEVMTANRAVADATLSARVAGGHTAIAQGYVAPRICAGLADERSGVGRKQVEWQKKAATSAGVSCGKPYPNTGALN